MPTEMVEYGHKIEWKLKAMQSKVNQNTQGSNSDGKETGTQIYNLEQEEEISIKPELWRNKNSKNEERLRNLQDIFKHSKIRIRAGPEGEEEDQEIENLFEKIMKDNFPNLAKEIDFQEVQEAQSVPKKLDPRKYTPRHIIITLPRLKRRRDS